MPATKQAVIVSAISGLVWAGVAWFLGRRALGPLIWGGVALSPLIGIAAGLASRVFPTGYVRRVLFSLASLYLAASVFGLGVGVYDLQTGANSGDGWYRIPSAVVLQSIVGTLWGLTFTGYFLVLWPLSYANHSLVSRLWKVSPSQSQRAG